MVFGHKCLQFFIVGLLEEKTFCYKSSNTIAKLKNCIRNEVAAITISDVCCRVMTNFSKDWRPVWRSEEE